MTTNDDDDDEVVRWNTEDATDLVRSQVGANDLQITSRDWTVRTMVDQISEENIDLDPGFQRRNAWRDARRSRLLESFILNFPVPQIVLAEHPKQKKKFIVIDGKQRLLTIASTYLPDYRAYWKRPEFTGLEVLTKLNKVSLDDLMTAPAHTAFRRQLDNADIRTTVISGFVDESVLYDIFYRINTGSVPLSSQELRQVLNRGRFAKYLMEETSKENPLWTVLGIDDADARLRDVELLLRLIAWRTRSKKYQGNMKPFLDDTMTHYNSTWSSDREEIKSLVPELLEGVAAAARVFGSDVGRKYSVNRFERALNRVVFEVQAYYFSFKDIRSAALKKKNRIVREFKELCLDPDFRVTIEATTKSIENYKVRFEMYRQALKQVLGKMPAALPLGHG
jgi:hypothetical protein